MWCQCWWRGSGISKVLLIYRWHHWLLSCQWLAHMMLKGVMLHNTNLCLCITKSLYPPTGLFSGNLGQFFAVSSRQKWKTHKSLQGAIAHWFKTVGLANMRNSILPSATLTFLRNYLAALENVFPCILCFWWVWPFEPSFRQQQNQTNDVDT